MLPESNTKNELQIRNDGSALVRFAVFDAPLPAIREAVTANLKGGNLTPRDLERIRIPSGGATAFTVPTLNGEITAKELRGVLIDFRDTRTYWRLAIGEGDGNAPPDCYSLDFVTGIGDPGGRCSDCPFSKFGSDGEAKPCREVRELYLVCGDSFLPVVIPIPPGSLKNSRQYFVRLASHGIPLWGVETVIGLEKAKSNQGVSFARATFTPGRLLEQELADKMKAYAEMLKPLLEAPAAPDDGLAGGDLVA